MVSRERLVFCGLHISDKYMKKELVKQFELDLLDPTTRRSPQKLATLLADDFFEFTQSGTVSTKQDVIDALPTSPEEKFNVRDYQEKKLTDNVVLVHYIVDRLVIESNLKRCTLCSSVWKYIDNRWQMIFFQGTPAKN